MRQIGQTCRHYSGLFIKKENNKYFWSIQHEDDDTCSDMAWDEIPKYLYDDFIKFEGERDNYD